MAVKISSRVGKLLYMVLFVVFLPLLLILWAVKTEFIFDLPIYDNPVAGVSLIIVGFLLMLFAMTGLLIHGKGLPMSPYPPVKYVSKGLYKFIAHPIYTGACLLTIGISIYSGYRSALWLISPFLILSCITFVLGFERENLKKSFPDFQFRPLITFPGFSSEPATVWNKISAYILVLLPWFILYRIVLFLGMPGDPVVSYLSFEDKIPVINFTIIICLLVYPLVLLAPLFSKTKKDLGNFMVSGLMATGTGFFVLFLFPLITPAKTVDLLYLPDILPELTPIGFPSFLVIWTFLTVPIYRSRFPSLKIVLRSFPVIVSVCCIFTGLYSIVDVLGGFCVYLFTANREIVWRNIRGFAEGIANSWKEWNFGYFRLMNHGILGGLATFCGIFIVAILIGRDNLYIILMVAVVGMICSALWAQFIEGSKKLLRPLGFYGGVIGVFLGCLLGHFIFETDFFLIFSAVAVAGPFIQAIGRLRCLVQGCCHGRKTSAIVGIRYSNFRSRVVGLSNLKGEYLHPTPVYSILANCVYGLVLIKLWFIDIPLPFIAGLSFIFNGFSRFVEESFRGEPQTRILAGLRLYQWMAIIGIILGAIMTTIPWSASRIPVQFNIETLVFAVLGGLLSTILTGIDFPRSNKRFSRLV